YHFFITLRLLVILVLVVSIFFFFQAEDGIRDFHVTGVQTCALPIFERHHLLTPAAGRTRPTLAMILEGEAVLACGPSPDELFLRALEPGDLVGEIDAFATLPLSRFGPGGGQVRERALPYETPGGERASSSGSSSGRIDDATA